MYGFMASNMLPALILKQRLIIYCAAFCQINVINNYMLAKYVYSQRTLFYVYNVEIINLFILYFLHAFFYFWEIYDVIEKCLVKSIFVV